MCGSRDQPSTRPHDVFARNTTTTSTLAMAFTALNNKPSMPVVPVQAPVPTPAPAPHPQEIDVAFAGSHELRKRVHAAIGSYSPTLSTMPSKYA
jgi:hypothetical protein